MENAPEVSGKEEAAEPQYKELLFSTRSFFSSSSSPPPGLSAAAAAAARSPRLTCAGRGGRELRMEAGMWQSTSWLSASSLGQPPSRKGGEEGGFNVSGSREGKGARRCCSLTPRLFPGPNRLQPPG